MGLSSTVPIQFYFGNGSSTIFPFPYEFFNQPDLQVFLFDTTQAVIYPQILNTNYTISGNQNYNGAYPGGGNVVIGSAFPSTTEMIIFRNPSPVNNYALNQNSPINSVALVQQLDYLTTLVQAQQYQLSQVLSLPAGQGQINGSSFSMLLPATIAMQSSAYQILQVNSGATGWQLFTLPGAGSIIPVSGGGTGQGAPLNNGGIMYAATSSQILSNSTGVSGQALLSGGVGEPYWGTVSLGSGSVTAGSISGVLNLTQGGTNTGSGYSYGVSSIIYNSGGTQFAGITTGGQDQVLVAQPIPGVASFGQVNLASGSSVKNILPVGFGGTGTGTSYIQYGVVFASSATQLANTVPGGLGFSLLGKGAGAAPVFEQMNLASSVQFTGILPVGNGGTGVSSSIFNALSPIATAGGIIVGSGSPVINATLGPGSANQFLQTNAAGTGVQWATVVQGSAAPNISLITTTCSMLLTTATNMVLSSQGSSATTITLFGASGNGGFVFKAKKIDAGSSVVTIVGSNAFIDGSSFVLIAQNEQVELVCDGANWQVANYYHQPVSMRWLSGSLAVTASFQTIAWKSRDYDTFNIMSGNGNMIINRAGKWRFESSICTQHTGVTGDNVNMALLVNGVQKSQNSLDGVTGATTLTAFIGDALSLNLNDTVAVQIENSNTSPVITSGSSLTWISAIYLGQ